MQQFGQNGMAARSEGRILLALWLMVFSASSQVVIMAPILPRIGVTLGITEVEQGSLILAYAVMLSVMALVAGLVLDRLGRRPMLLAGRLSDRIGRKPLIVEARLALVVGYSLPEPDVQASVKEG